MTTKDIIINSFKESCFKSTSFKERLNYTLSQYQRAVWQIQTIHGLTRIEKKEASFTITLFPFINNSLHLNDKVSFNISEAEYEELKSIYTPPIILDYCE